MPGQLTKLSKQHVDFPPAQWALNEPDGLLAIGGDLSVQRLINAYQHGIFPWFSEGEPLMWWSPSQRATIFPTDVHISKSMAKFIRQTTFTVTINNAFHEVVEACSKPRKTQNETWISKDIKSAYIALHDAEVAHSIEVWDGPTLVGGLYGVNVGSVFCGESMFHTKSNASKLAFIGLCQYMVKCDGQLIDCQMTTDHLQSLGVKTCRREDFLLQLQQYQHSSMHQKCWSAQTILIN